MNQLTTPNTDPMSLSEAVAKSGIAGAKTKEAAFTLACMALAEDKDASTNPMAFMAALGRASTSYHLINGRPTMKAECMLSRFQVSGGTVRWTEYSDKRVSGIFSHPAGGTLELDWTIDRAKTAGLVKPGSPWIAHPRAMLRSRVIVEAIRTIYPAVLNGTMEPDEAREIHVDTQPQTVTVPPRETLRDEARQAYIRLAATDKATADAILAETGKDPAAFLERVRQHEAPVIVEEIQDQTTTETTNQEPQL